MATGEMHAANPMANPIATLENTPVAAPVVAPVAAPVATPSATAQRAPVRPPRTKPPLRARPYRREPETPPPPPTPIVPLSSDPHPTAPFASRWQRQALNRGLAAACPTSLSCPTQRGPEAGGPAAKRRAPFANARGGEQRPDATDASSSANAQPARSRPGSQRRPFEERMGVASYADAFGWPRVLPARPRAGATRSGFGTPSGPAPAAASRQSALGVQRSAFKVQRASKQTGLQPKQRPTPVRCAGLPKTPTTHGPDAALLCETQSAMEQPWVVSGLSREDAATLVSAHLAAHAEAMQRAGAPGTPMLIIRRPPPPPPAPPPQTPSSQPPFIDFYPTLTATATTVSTAMSGSVVQPGEEMPAAERASSTAPTSAPVASAPSATGSAPADSFARTLSYLTVRSDASALPSVPSRRVSDGSGVYREARDLVEAALNVAEWRAKLTGQPPTAPAPIAPRQSGFGTQFYRVAPRSRVASAANAGRLHGRPASRSRAHAAKPQAGVADEALARELLQQLLAMAFTCSVAIAAARNGPTVSTPTTPSDDAPALITDGLSCPRSMRNLRRNARSQSRLLAWWAFRAAPWRWPVGPATRCTAFGRTKSSLRHRFMGRRFGGLRFSPGGSRSLFPRAGSAGGQGDFAWHDADPDATPDPPPDATPAADDRDDGHATLSDPSAPAHAADRAGAWAGEGAGEGAGEREDGGHGSQPIQIHVPMSVQLAGSLLRLPSHKLNALEEAAADEPEVEVERKEVEQEAAGAGAGAFPWALPLLGRTRPASASAALCGSHDARDACFASPPHRPRLHRLPRLQPRARTPPPSPSRSRTHAHARSKTASGLSALEEPEGLKGEAAERSFDSAAAPPRKTRLRGRWAL